ncbi:substrate import-associated zinc metallohydrolase lipoprotein [Carboxylicivirga taeanensis]|uniref:substrate import-associated zinc metallohydrolase lipoprotein n=1 Tax=Carboxylicivirga taeanensis TaxID=1416875 RepID=UPI003F6E174D
MKKLPYNISKICFALLIIISLANCTSDDVNDKYIPPVVAESNHPNDLYLKGLFDKFGTAIRWRWDDRFIKPTQRAVPIADSLVIPVTQLIEYLWIGSYESVGEAGERFMLDLFPPELQYMGSYIYKNDGTILLGFAEAGARITLLNLNAYDLQDREWLTSPSGGVLATVHHEFTHIVHQNYAIPIGFNKISDRYLGNGWSNNVSLNDAIKLGMVRNYGTMNEHEDFCEIVSHYLTMPLADFNSRYITLRDLSSIEDLEERKEEEALNAGRVKIAQKLDMILKYYQNSFDIDLTAVQKEMEERINYVIEYNEIPTK